MTPAHVTGGSHSLGIDAGRVPTRHGIGGTAARRLYGSPYLGMRGGDANDPSANTCYRLRRSGSSLRFRQDLTEKSTR